MSDRLFLAGGGSWRVQLNVNIAIDCTSVFRSILLSFGDKMEVFYQVAWTFR